MITLPQKKLKVIAALRITKAPIIAHASSFLYVLLASVSSKGPKDKRRQNLI